MRTHGLVHVENEEFFPKTVEQKIVFMLTREPMAISSFQLTKGLNI